jgi:hypothetical protein
VTSLVEFSNFVLSEMKDGLEVVAVYTDFLKAFDRVNHGSWVVVGQVVSKIPWFDDFLDGFLFDRSYTTRSGWRLFVWDPILENNGMPLSIEKKAYL